jgi:hydrogenase nickel incorporation protein HypA/HybF
MHELSVCLALIEQVERIVGEHDARAVTNIVLDIGPLSGVEPALLRHAWPLASAGTVADAAKLQIETAEVVVTCTQCESDSTVAANRLLCAACGDYRTRIKSGDEMLLRRVELDVPLGRNAVSA